MKITQNKNGSFIKQAAILAIAGMVVRFLGFLYRVPLTSMLGDVGNALYASGYYIYTFLLILSSAGLPAAISKMVSERVALERYEDAHNVFWVSLLVAGVGGLTCSLILFIGARFISIAVNNPESYYCLLTLSPTILIVAIMSCFRGYFQGLNTTVPTALSQIVEQFFNAVFSVFLAYVLLGKGLPFAAAGGTAGTGIGAFAGLICIFTYYMINRKDIIGRVRENRQHPNRKEARKSLAITLVKTALPIIIGTAIFSITNLADMKMVLSRLDSSGAFTEEAAKALYGQLTGKYVVLTTLPVSFATALATAAVPNIAAAMVDKDTSNVKRKIDLALRITMLISFPAAMGIGVLGEQILALLWPNAKEGGILLQTGAVAVIFLVIAQISTGALQGIGRVRIPAIAAGIGAIVKIVLKYYLIPIPEINVIGAVISTIACYLIAGLIDFYYLLKFSQVKPDYPNIFIKPLVASIVMGICSHFIYIEISSFGLGNSSATLVTIAISVAIYFLVMFLLRGIKEADILMLPRGESVLKFCKKIKLMRD